jgi:hypothetical protein
MTEGGQQTPADLPKRAATLADVAELLVEANGKLRQLLNELHARVPTRAELTTQELQAAEVLEQQLEPLRDGLVIEAQRLAHLIRTLYVFDPEDQLAILRTQIPAIEALRSQMDVVISLHELSLALGEPEWEHR